MMMVSSAISSVGSIIGGIGAKNEAKLNAFNIETDKKLNQAQAAQMANARKEEYDLATSSNIAAFSAAGRDIGSDRSVKAFLDKQKEIMGKDVGRIQTQTRIEDLKSTQQAAAVRREGQQALIGSLFDAASTSAKGYSYHLQAK
jgi:hypothetical protein